MNIMNAVSPTHLLLVIKHTQALLPEIQTLDRTDIRIRYNDIIVTIAYPQRVLHIGQ